MSKPPLPQPIYGTHTHVGGLDASTKRIGYCAPNGSMHSIEPDKLRAHPTPWDLGVRCNTLKTRLTRAIRLNPPAPTLVMYEAAFFMHAGSSARLDELRGVLRDSLIEQGIEFVEINNVHVKLFAAGKSAADKTIMTHAAASRIRDLGLKSGAPRNDDEADAWHLRMMGRVGLGLDVAVARYQLDAIEACRVVFS